jgi:hypothetical protein
MRHERTVRVARQARDAASIAKYTIGSLWIGWGTWIRTKTNRVRVCCATVTPFPNGLLSKFNSLRNCSAIAPWAANRRPASRRSTRSPPHLASPQLMRQTARHVTRSYDLRRRQGLESCGDCGHLEAIDEPRQKPRRSRQQVWCVDAGRAVCPRAASLALAPFNFGVNCALLASRVFRDCSVFKRMTSMSHASGSPQRPQRNGE